MKLEVAKSTNFKQPRVTSLRREKKTVCVRMEGNQFLVHIFMATVGDQHKGSLGIWGFSHFGYSTADVLAENDVTDIMGV